MKLLCSIFGTFIICFCLTQCSNGNLVYPRYPPSRSSFGHGVYRRSRNGEIIPYRHSAPDLWEYDNFKDVVAAVVSRLKSLNSSAKVEDDLQESVTEFSENSQYNHDKLNTPPSHTEMQFSGITTKPYFTLDMGVPYASNYYSLTDTTSPMPHVIEKSSESLASTFDKSAQTENFFVDGVTHDSIPAVAISEVPSFKANNHRSFTNDPPTENISLIPTEISGFDEVNYRSYEDNTQSVPNRPFTGQAGDGSLPEPSEKAVTSKSSKAANPYMFPNFKSSNFQKDDNQTEISNSATQVIDLGATSHSLKNGTSILTSSLPKTSSKTVFNDLHTPTVPYSSSEGQVQNGKTPTTKQYNPDLLRNGDFPSKERPQADHASNLTKSFQKYVQINRSSSTSAVTSEQNTSFTSLVTETYEKPGLDTDENYLMDENSVPNVTKRPSFGNFTEETQTPHLNYSEAKLTSDFVSSTSSPSATVTEKKLELSLSTPPLNEKEFATTSQMENSESVVLSSSKRYKNHNFAHRITSEKNSSFQSSTTLSSRHSVTTPLTYRKRNNKLKPTPKHNFTTTTQIHSLNDDASSIKPTSVYRFTTSSSKRNKLFSTPRAIVRNETSANRHKLKPLYDSPNYQNESRPSDAVYKNETRRRFWTTTTTTTTSYPPQNDVPWNTEHRNIPMSDSEEDDEIIVKIKPRYEEDPFIEPPEPFAEPGPEWRKAKKEWGIAWEIHIYITGPLFAVLAAYSGISVVRLLMMPNLHSKCYFICLNFMMLIMGVTRAVYLMHDSYNSNCSYPAVLSYFLYNISTPCLTSSFAILFLALLQATKLRLLSPKIQKPIILAAIIAFHFGFSTTTDIIVGSLLGTTVLLFVCHLISVVWALALAVAYFYIFRKLHKAALRKQGELIRITFTRLHIDGGDLPKHLPKARLGLAVKITLATAVFGFLMSVAQLYGMVCVFEYFSLDRPEPWPWWGFHFTCRILELGMYITMTFIATQPVRHFEADSSPACVSTSWHPCNVFVGFGCARKDPMVAYSSSCLAHHSFRNPGFSSTLDTPQRNWEQTNFQPSLQAATLERKDLSLVTEDHKPQNESLLSLCSIKKSIISVDVDTNDVKKSCSTLNLENQVNSLARSTKSEKTSMLYKENGFIRFRTDNDPEQPMEESDCEDDDHTRDDAIDDRFSTMATAGSAVQSIADEDQLQKSVSQFYSAGYWSPRAKRLSRSSMDTTVESGMNTSIECLNNLVIARAGISNSAQEFSMFRYGSTCSSESAGNSFDVYLHSSSRSPRQNDSSGNLNGVAKRRIRNSTSGSAQYRESFISSSDNDAGDNNDLTSEDCATRSLLSQGDIDETISKNDEIESLSPCCHCNADSRSSPNLCIDCKALIPLANANFCDDASVRETYLNSIMPMVIGNKEITNSTTPASSKINAATTAFFKERANVFPKIEENVSGKDCLLKNGSPSVFGTNSETHKLKTNAKAFEPKQGRRFQKASKSQSVDDLTKSSTYWDPSIRTKKQSRTLWQKLRGSTFSLNTNLLGYELLTADAAGIVPKRSGSDVVVQRSASDRRPRATSTMKNSGRSYEHIDSFSKGKSEVVQQSSEGINPLFLSAEGNEVVLVLDSDNCSQISDVSV